MKPISYTHAGLLIDYDDKQLKRLLRKLISVQFTKLKKDRPWAERVLIVEKDFSVLQKIVNEIRDNTYEGLEAGYIYAPYIPLQLEPIMVNENDFTPRKEMKSRYSNVQVNNNNYGTVSLAAL